MSRRHLGTAVVLVGFLVDPDGAQALTDVERTLLRQSIRPSELKSVEAAVGGLDALALLQLEIDFDLDSRVIEGEARLDWPNTTGRALNEIVFRLSANGPTMAAPSARFTDLKATLPGASPFAVVAKAESDTVFHVKLPSQLKPGERLVLSGRLSGALAQLADGATDPAQASLSAFSGGGGQPDGAQYGTFACGDDICTLTGFVPQIPAFLDGAFDTAEGTGIGDATYSEPMNLLFSVVTAPDVTLAATGIELGRARTEHGRRRTSYALAAARELGLVASREFIVSEATVGEVRVRSLSLRAHKPAGIAALSAAKSALADLEKAFGPYPWVRLDIAEAALTGGAGGVELPGLALGASGFYRPLEGLLALADPDGRLATDILDFITRHEVAHQWWHAQVGSHAQRHPYVDEPLAQWSALLSTRRTLGAKAANRAKDLQIGMNFQALELMGQADGPVARGAAEFASSVEYAGLVYGKAPLFYEALSREIGEKAVLSALRGLVAKFRFRRATPDDLRTALVAAGGKKGARVDLLWKRWFLEAHGDEDVHVAPSNLPGALGSLGGLGALPKGLLGGGGPGSIDAKALQDALKAMQELMGGSGYDDED